MVRHVFVFFIFFYFFFSSRRRHTRLRRDWSSDVCSSDLGLVDGSLASGIVPANQILIQVGIENNTASRINLNTEINLAEVTSTGLSIQNLSVTSSLGALSALETINTAIATVTSSRGQVGAVQNRLVRAVSNLAVTTENLQAAESTIRDADIAAEIGELTRNQILVQSATAMVGQANLIPQSILLLLA